MADEGEGVGAVVRGAAGEGAVGIALLDAVGGEDGDIVGDEVRGV